MMDVQSQPDDRGIPLDQVGVTGLRYPITVMDRENGKQETIAQITMSVSLPHHFKGTHMSRFLELLNEHRGEVTIRTLPDMLKRMRERLDAESSQIELIFPYFLERSAPVSGAKGLMDYECSFTGEMKGADIDFTVGVKVPITSLCPCSKEISDYGAHNQRGVISARVKSRKDISGLPRLIWLEELIELAEDCGSSPVYPILKREDERYVTMRAFETPAFVEDIARRFTELLINDERVETFTIHVENFESIHNHSAFATVTITKGVGNE